MILLKRNFKLHFPLEKFCVLRVPIIVTSERNEKKIRRNELVKGVMKEERMRDRLCRLDTAIVVSLHRLMVLRIPLSGLVVALRRSDAAERMEKAPKGMVVCRPEDDASMYRSELAFSQGCRYT